MANQSYKNQSGKNDHPPIAIKTSWGKHLGMGHLQRMASLLWYLNERKSIKAFLITDSVPGSFPAELIKFVKDNIDFDPSIIIRDMRDSSRDEITSLGKISKVLTIDDNGEGRTIADYVIDILPNPETTAKKPNFETENMFLYGYNFINALFKIKNTTINKNLDFVIYPGNSADSERIDFLISLLPINSSYAILCAEESYSLINGTQKPLEKSSYAEIILSSKSLISHFGITLYEGFISGCRLFTINPTSYHSLLAEITKKNLGLTNLGIHDEIEKDKTVNILKMSAKNPLHERINPEDVYDTTIENLEHFYRMLITII